MYDLWIKWDDNSTNSFVIKELPEKIKDSKLSGCDFQNIKLNNGELWVRPIKIIAYAIYENNQSKGCNPLEEEQIYDDPLN